MLPLSRGVFGTSLCVFWGGGWCPPRRVQLFWLLVPCLPGKAFLGISLSLSLLFLLWAILHHGYLPQNAKLHSCDSVAWAVSLYHEQYCSMAICESLKLHSSVSVAEGCFTLPWAILLHDYVQKCAIALECLSRWRLLQLTVSWAISRHGSLRNV